MAPRRVKSKSVKGAVSNHASITHMHATIIRRIRPVMSVAIRRLAHPHRHAWASTHPPYPIHTPRTHTPIQILDGAHPDPPTPTPPPTSKSDKPKPNPSPCAHAQKTRNRKRETERLIGCRLYTLSVFIHGYTGLDWVRAECEGLMCLLFTVCAGLWGYARRCHRDELRSRR